MSVEHKYHMRHMPAAVAAAELAAVAVVVAVAAVAAGCSSGLMPGQQRLKPGKPERAASLQNLEREHWSTEQTPESVHDRADSSADCTSAAASASGHRLAAGAGLNGPSVGCRWSDAARPVCRLLNAVARDSVD